MNRRATVAGQGRRRRTQGRRGALRLLLAVAFAGGVLLCTAGAAGAHPLGRFTVNTASGLLLSPERVTVDQVVDFAELPTFQERAALDADRDGAVSAAERTGWAAARCADLAGTADARIAGSRLAFMSGPSSATLAPGEAGLDVLRLECQLSAPLAPAGAGTGERALAWRSTAYADRVGWHEVTAAGDGVRLVASDVPSTSPSARLSAYPTDLLATPMVRQQASVRFAPGGPGLGGDAPRASQLPAIARPVDRAVATLTGLVKATATSPAAALLAVALALGLGALHALAPGHGKTVMAAYLVGLRGTVRDAALIGGTVTLTHTAGVLTLGLTLSATKAFAPERLYPFLGVASGLLLALLGIGLLRRTLTGRSGHAHSHAVPHAHGHGAHEHGTHEHAAHGHEGYGHGHAGRERPRPRDLVALGFAGGLSPSPSALLVLLGAVALGKASLGALLVLAYGAGMALTLTAAGLLLVRARGLASRWKERRLPSWLAPATQAAPAGTAALIVLGGLGLAARSVVQL
jgi:nickel/cobalt exporter